MPRRAAQSEPPLIDAIIDRDLERVRQLLAEGADPNTTSNDGRPALERASWFAEGALALIDAGADVKKLVGNQFNAVWAAGTGRADLVRQVLDAGADVNCHTYSGTPAHVAAREGHADVLRQLIERGADVNAGSMVSNPLVDAVENDHTECALMLLRAGAKLDMSEVANDRTLLTQAAHHRNGELVEALLAAGVPADERGKVTGMDEETMKVFDRYAKATPLLIAARLGDARSVEALLKAGANTALRDEDGNRPLDLARQGGHADVAELIERGRAGASDPGEDLLLAAEKGDVARVRSLLASGADVNARDNRSRCKHSTPLLLAVRAGHADAARALLDDGADPALDDAGSDKDRKLARMMFSQTDPESIRELGLTLGRAPLAEAASRGDLDLVGELLARGAQIDQSDYFGVTPLMLAARRGHTAVLRRLLAAGASVKAAASDKATALSEAITGGSADCAAALLAAGAKILTGKQHNLLGRAARRNVELVDVLLRHGAPVDTLDTLASTPLMHAAETGRLDVVRRLLDAGANVNHRNQFGDAPLNEAAKLGVSATEWKTLRKTNDPRLHQRAELCRVLLDAGADVNNVTGSGFTALTVAVLSYNDPLARLLLERGANAALGTIAGKPLSQTARENGAPADVVESLEKARGAKATRPRPVGAPTAKKTRAPKIKRRSKAPPQPAPDFSGATDRKEYLDAITDMERRCGTKAVAFEHAPGCFHFHVDSRSNFDFGQARKDLHTRGCAVVWLDPLRHQQVALFPTTDPFEVLRAIGTSAPNSDLDNDDIVAWLRDLYAEHPFEITGVRHDVVEGHFLGPITDTKAMARRMEEFCSDIVSQGCGTVAALAKALKGDRPPLYFWWD